MSELELFSQRNVMNAVGKYLATQLLGAGYLVYFHAADALQTPDAWYPNYSANIATYKLDATFAARLAGAKGIVTLHDGDSAFPRLLARPTNEGSPATQAEVQVPVFGIDVDTDVVLQTYEAGTGRCWRTRALHLDGRARDKGEMLALASSLEIWLDDETIIDVADADGLSGQGPGVMTVMRRSVSRDIVPDAGDQDRFQVELHARLEYVA